MSIIIGPMAYTRILCGYVYVKNIGVRSMHYIIVINSSPKTGKNCVDVTIFII